MPALLDLDTRICNVLAATHYSRFPYEIAQLLPEVPEAELGWRALDARLKALVDAGRIGTHRVAGCSPTFHALGNR
ncbi:hypothetical protein QNA23_10735 [Rhodococcus erythropolis]|uniref:hypothetical protein n=1 Tax=Rhodococcus erythropolis TaxID=1833 RepID=UPI0024BA1A99|nr:hypothetical protein [Rhodococcus erythropolis]MDJ0403958.1 hypothetical protein [Rhodococcus erythropolis]